MQRAKGLCIATRCETVDQFVATFQRYCEESAIFVPNARRPVGTLLPFSFELANEESVLIGIGTVLEEFTTGHNRFERPGIVISVQKLKRESIAVFERMLAERTKEAERIPAPVFARTVTGPVAVDEVLKTRRTPTRPLEVQIPSVGDRPKTTKPRANTVLGIPVIPKTPAKQAVMKIPDIPTRQSRSFPVPAVSSALDPDTLVEAVPDPIAEVQDTARDEFPFALRHELRMLETRAQVAQVAKPTEIDSGWDVDATPTPTPAAALGALPTPEAILIPVVATSKRSELMPVPAEAIPEPIIETAAAKSLVVPVAAVDTAAFAETIVESVTYEVSDPPAPEPVAPPVREAEPARAAVLAVAPPVEMPHPEAIPLLVPLVPSDATTAPAAKALRTAPRESGLLPTFYPWWQRPLRWATRAVLASIVFVTAAAVTASTGEERSIVTVPEQSVHSSGGSSWLTSAITPPACSSVPTPEQPLFAPEHVTMSEEMPVVRDETKPPVTAPARPAPAAQPSMRLPAPAPAAQRPTRPAAVAPRARVAKSKCNSLDCL